MSRLTVLAAAMLFAAVSPAWAHISLSQNEAAAGTTYKAVLVIGHGCGEEATTKLRVQIPEGFYNVKPMPKAGWTIETVVGPYDTPFVNHGTELTEGVKEISWSGGSLPNEQFDEFVFRGTLGGNLEAGSTLYFPVIQVCGSTEDAWIDVSGDHDAEYPAPALTVLPAEEHGH